MPDKNIYPRKVLIIHSWGLGDMILLTPVLSTIHLLFPDVRFSFLIFQKVSSRPILLAPYTQDVVYSGWGIKSILRTLYRLNSKKFDAAAFTSGVNPLKAGLFLTLIKSMIKVGEFSNYKFPILTKYSKINTQKSRTENNYNILSQLFDMPVWSELINHKEDYQLRPRFYLDSKSRDYAESFYKQFNPDNCQTICIHPGCLSKNKYRRWPATFFIELIQLIEDNKNTKILIISGPDEIQEAKQISAETNSPLVSNESLENVAAIISGCDVFINTDSGLGHIASCFGKKTLTIFGPGDEKQTIPFSENSHIVRNQISCAPCINRKKRRCQSECLTGLMPEEVYREFTKLL